jgi:hypothetical protein
MWKKLAFIDIVICSYPIVTSSLTLDFLPELAVRREREESY